MRTRTQRELVAGSLLAVPDPRPPAPAESELRRYSRPWHQGR